MDFQTKTLILSFVVSIYTINLMKIKLKPFKLIASANLFMKILADYSLFRVYNKLIQKTGDISYIRDIKQ